MKTTQKLTWLENNENRFFLLMPNEALEFKYLLENFGLDFAFDRLTGQSIENKSGITLVQKTFVSLND